MKRLVQIGSLLLAGVAIAFLHPFDLVMPWQSGSPGELDIAMQRIMSGERYELVELNWGRLTPFNYVAVNARYRTNGLPSNTCTNLRSTLENWGRVTAITRHEEGCEIEARGPGPMTANVDVAVDPELRPELRIDIRVQHTS